MPHPYFVPVRPTCSRITHSKGVVGSTSTLCDCPLIVSATIIMPPYSPVGEPFIANSRAIISCWRGFSQARVGRKTSGFGSRRTSQFREREQMSQDGKIEDWIGLQRPEPSWPGLSRPIHVLPDWMTKTWMAAFLLHDAHEYVMGDI